MWPTEVSMMTDVSRCCRVVALDRGRQRRAVHLRHVVIQQDEVVAVARRCAAAQRGQSLRSPARSFVAHSPGGICSCSMRRLTSLSSTTSTRSPRSSPTGSGAARGSVPSGSGTVNQNVRALRPLALDADRAAHQLDQLLRDGQAQARAAVLPRGGAVHLAELLEESAAACPRECRCPCRARKPHAAPRATSLARSHRDQDVAALR